jgi:hypothetical protein
MLASLSQKRVPPQKPARCLVKDKEEEEEEEDKVSDETMSRQFRRSPGGFRRSPDVSRSASPAGRAVPPVVVDLTTTIDGRSLVIGPEDSLLCGPCKDNGIISHGARHLCRCEHQLVATTVNRHVKLIWQHLKNTREWGAAVERGLALPATPHPDVVKAIKALGNTNKKLLDLGPEHKATLEQVVDDSLTIYWSSKGFPVKPLVASGLPAFITDVINAPKVKIEGAVRPTRYDSPERERYGSPERARYDSRGRSHRRSSGSRRRSRRDWSSSSGSDYSRGPSSRKRYKKEYVRGGPGGPPEDLKESPEVVAAAAAAAFVAETTRLEAERVEAKRVEADRVEAERVEADRVEAERVETNRLEAERVEAERVEAEPVEAERVEAVRVEAERVEAEPVETNRLEAERVEAKRVEAERVEADRVANPPVPPGGIRVRGLNGCYVSS